MSASLVGSEMCIRDSSPRLNRKPLERKPKLRDWIARSQVALEIRITGSLDRTIQGLLRCGRP
eukprot:14709077-Alexandrium_andersonii.AAC.1